MASLKTKDIESALLRKGFRKHDSHHTYYWLYDGEKKTNVRTFISHGGREYPDNMLSPMSKQLRVTKRQLLALVDCPLSREDYLDLLVKKGDVIRE
jgi:predicted RNA binding protein YcfA (HicA-like mRNA interferase family)